MDAKVKLKKEYEKLILSKWKFLENIYRPIEVKNYHRTIEQDIRNIQEIKKELYNKLGPIPVFIFIIDLINFIF